MRKQVEFTAEETEAKFDAAFEAAKEIPQPDEVVITQPCPAIRLEDGSIFGVSNIVGLRVLPAGQLTHVQVMLAGFQEWATHMSTRNRERAEERFAELSQYLCDVIIEPLVDVEAVPLAMGPVPAGNSMPRRPEQTQYGGFGENRRYPNPTTVGRPIGSPAIDNALYVKPEIVPVPGLTANEELPSSKWASSVTIQPKTVPGQ